jgi:hypothetical protein
VRWLIASILFSGFVVGPAVPQPALGGTTLPLMCNVVVAMGGNKLWFRVTNPTGASQTCNITCNWLDNSGTNHTDSCTNADVPIGANKFTSCVRPAPLGRPGVYSGIIDCTPKS